MNHSKTPKDLFRSRVNTKAVTLVEVLIASAISAIVTISAITSVIYYQRVAAMNHRLAMVSNLIESEMENIKNQTWYTLGNPDDGFFDPDPFNTRNPPGGWPVPGEVPERALFKRFQTVADIPPAGLADEYVGGIHETFTGIAGEVAIFYSPIVVTHTARGENNVGLEYDVRYWKVEVVVTLEGSQRIRRQVDMDPVRPGEQDIWTAVTYISELSGRGDAEFTIRNLQKLRERQRIVSL